MLFLTTERVLEIHVSAVVSAYPGDCDVARLDSAVHAVESYASYGDPEDTFDLGAAYAFYICEAHTFVDGNKRTAFVACMDFLELNGVRTHHYNRTEPALWMLDLAKKQLTRAGFAENLRLR